MRLPLGLQLIESSSPGTGSLVAVWTPSRVHILTTLKVITFSQNFSTRFTRIRHTTFHSMSDCGKYKNHYSTRSPTKHKTRKENLNYCLN